MAEELLFVLRFVLIGAFLIGVVTQIMIPLAFKTPLFPMFNRSKGANLLRDIEELRRNELVDEIERARREEQILKLEEELKVEQEKVENHKARVRGRN